MSLPPSTKVVKSNKLVLPSLVLACIAVAMAPFAYLYEAVFVYVFLVLPLGFSAALLAKIALTQIRRAAGPVMDRNLAVVAYFLGLLPALSLCGVLTLQLQAF